MTPRFATLWKKPWPYTSSNGVGLRMTGLPTSVDEFTEVLMGFGCHPKAVHRILDRVTQNGYDLLTVMAYLDFDLIAVRLNQLGVRMEIVPPLLGWKSRFNDGDWPSSFVPPHVRASQ